MAQDVETSRVSGSTGSIFYASPLLMFAEGKRQIASRHRPEPQAPVGKIAVQFSSTASPTVMVCSSLRSVVPVVR